MSANSQGSSASAFAITPNDSSDLPSSTRAIYVGVTGNLRVQLTDDSSFVDFISLQGGTIYGIRCKRVYSTGTSAASLVGLQ